MVMNNRISQRVSHPSQIDRGYFVFNSITGSRSHERMKSQSLAVRGGETITKKLSGDTDKMLAAGTQCQISSLLDTAVSAEMTSDPDQSPDASVWPSSRAQRVKAIRSKKWR